MKEKRWWSGPMRTIAIGCAGSQTWRKVGTPSSPGGHSKSQTSQFSSKP